jgi:hypothetical protein
MQLADNLIIKDMTKVLEILKKIWAVFKTIAISESFILSFPFLVLGIIALASHNFLIITSWVVWTVACVVNVLKK